LGERVLRRRSAVKVGVSETGRERKEDLEKSEGEVSK